MSDEPHKQGKQGMQGNKQEALPKKPYASPRLIEYGRALDLVGGDTGSQQENNPGMGAMKFP